MELRTLFTRRLQKGWERIADKMFSAGTAHDDAETARGEFISDFISEQGDARSRRDVNHPDLHSTGPRRGGSATAAMARR